MSENKQSSYKIAKALLKDLIKKNVKKGLKKNIKKTKLAVYGDFGSGKTTLIKNIQNELKDPIQDNPENNAEQMDQLNNEERDTDYRIKVEIVDEIFADKDHAKNIMYKNNNLINVEKIQNLRSISKILLSLASILITILIGFSSSLLSSDMRKLLINGNKNLFLFLYWGFFVLIAILLIIGSILYFSSIIRIKNSELKKADVIVIENIDRLDWETILWITSYFDHTKYHQVIIYTFNPNNILNIYNAHNQTNNKNVLPFIEKMFKKWIDLKSYEYELESDIEIKENIIEKFNIRLEELPIMNLRLIDNCMKSANKFIENKELVDNFDLNRKLLFLIRFLKEYDNNLFYYIKKNISILFNNYDYNKPNRLNGGLEKDMNNNIIYSNEEYISKIMHEFLIVEGRGTNKFPLPKEIYFMTFEQYENSLSKIINPEDINSIIKSLELPRLSVDIKKVMINKNWDKLIVSNKNNLISYIAKLDIIHDIEDSKIEELFSKELSDNERYGILSTNSSLASRLMHNIKNYIIQPRTDSYGTPIVDSFTISFTKDALDKFINEKDEILSKHRQIIKNYPNEFSHITVDQYNNIISNKIRFLLNTWNKLIQSIFELDENNLRKFIHQYNVTKEFASSNICLEIVYIWCKYHNQKFTNFIQEFKNNKFEFSEPFLNSIYRKFGEEAFDIKIKDRGVLFNSVHIRHDTPNYYYIDNVYWDKFVSSEWFLK